MILSEIDFSERAFEDEKNALRLSNDNPRKAYFRRLNMDKKINRPLKKFRDTGVSSRGNIWLGNAHSQRVVVKINPVKNKARKISSALNGGRVSYGGSGANLSAHIGYISRSGAGEDKERAILFDKENEGIKGREFFERSRDDRHHFRMIISPENGHDIEDFRGYVRGVMGRVEKDLGTKLDWVSAVHYDTDDIHAHVVVRGKKENGQDLVIARDYIAFGIRARAQELASELLGERSLDDIEKSIERDVDALRVTSLDRFLAAHLDEEQKVDVRKEVNFGKSRFYEQALKGRLRYLESTGLATQNPPGVFRLQEDYRDTLYAIQNRSDVLKQLHGRLSESELSALSLYSIKAGEGQLLEGFVKNSGFSDEITDKKYLVIEDIAQGLHYVPLGENARAQDLKEGTLIRVRPGDCSSGKADFNIHLMAVKNGGIYDIEKHTAYIAEEMPYIAPENRQGYLDSHIKRLETLEKNGVLERLDEGRYRVPDDVIAKGAVITAEINAREQKRFYPLVDILSKEPLEDLAGLEKKTWLDKELYRRSHGKSGLDLTGERIEKALKARQDWLVSKELGFIQSNGEFSLRDYALRKLDVMEVLDAGQTLARKGGLTFNERKVQEGAQYSYIGFVTLETGHWAVVRNSAKQLQMAQLEKKPELEQGACVGFTPKEGASFEMHQFERQQQKQKSRDIERDDGMEL